MTGSDIARALGRRGGLARGKRLTTARKQAIAAMGAHARIESLRIARRIAANFRYAEAARALRGTPRLTRVTRFNGRLPDVGRGGRER
jgi:hypothetical protein